MHYQYLNTQTLLILTRRNGSTFQIKTQSYIGLINEVRCYEVQIEESEKAW